MSVRELLAEARGLLADRDAGALEAEVLLCHVLGVNRAWLYANSGENVGGLQKRKFQELVSRRARGEPVAYLTGEREFWSLPFAVTPDVLIPRPETELLVEVALEHLPIDSTARVADLGTGSGAVAVAIARERPCCELHATDISARALAVAKQNAESLAPGRIAFHRGSWLEPLRGEFRLIVSNPPYVAENDPHLSRGDCRFEPGTALTPGGDGLAAIRVIAEQSVAFLEKGGCLLFEHGFDQGAAARAVLSGLGYTGVATRCDLEGRERVTLGLL